MYLERCKGFGSECAYIMICVQTISQRLYRTIFYLGGIFFAGLLVPADNDRLGSDKQIASSSPFVIAFDLAGVKIVSITF